MTKNEALKMAIEAMTSPNNLSFLMAITACKEALEQPAKMYEMQKDGTLKVVDIFKKYKSAINNQQIEIDWNDKNQNLSNFVSSIYKNKMILSKFHWFKIGIKWAEKFHNVEIENTNPAPQPAQEPDYWLGYGLQAHDEKPFEGATPLYTHPALSWQGLSDDEKLAIIRKWKDEHTMRAQELIGLGDAFEQALKEKNNAV